MTAPVIVRVRSTPGGTNQYGDPIASTVARTTIEGAFVAPRESSDIDGGGRTGVLIGLTLFAPYGSDLRDTDDIEVDGVLFTIEGDVGQWRNPFTSWEAGASVALKRVEG